MKCCKKLVAVAVIAALGMSTIYVVRSGWSDVIGHRVSHLFKKQISPEAQLERVKVQIGKLQQDINDNCTPIAAREYDIKSLKKELENKKDKLSTSKAELEIAAKALKDNVQRVSYNGRDYGQSEVRRLIKRDLTAFESLSKEVDSKGKLLAAWQRELDALMARQQEMKRLRGELEARVAQIEADLQVLRLAETTSKLPSGNMSRLDDIKTTLAELEKSNEIKMRALELRDQYDRGENVSGTSKDADSNDELINKIKAVTGITGDDASGK